jgi:signal transduction histidine kinase
MLPYVTRTLEGESCTFETAIGAAGAPARQTRVTLSPHRNFSGEVEGFVALVTDVTEHKASAGRSRLLADASKALSSSFDYQTTLRRVAELVVPGLADWCKIEIAAPGEHGAPCVVEHPVPEAGVAGLGLGDHAPDPLSTFTAAVMIHEEKVGGITLARSSAGPRFEAPDLAVIEELARRIALAVENAHLYGKAQRAIRLRDEFMSIASHELRTPLTALSLDLEVVMRLLERQGSEGRIMQRANKLSAHLGRLKQLVLTLLDVSQIEAGRLVIAAEAMDLRIVVGEVIDRFTEQAALAQCELHPELPPEPVEGSWDRLRIDQVLTNLLSNAIRYAPGRPIEIKLVAAPAAVTLTVRDHGPGIRPEDRERIFGRFERAVSGRGIGGFGLGLWITRQIIIALGGSVRVESVPNVETSFIIELPRTL